MNEAQIRQAIERKREGHELDHDLWQALIVAYMDGVVDDAQMAALCMASLWRGLSETETFALTDAIVHSGASVRFSDSIRVVDKHSSGGVSDIVSLVAVPLAAACGAKVAKLSGRALGHTGGTIDKLETIRGFDVALSLDRFVAQVEKIGCAISAQSAEIVPADKRLYHLRDHTGTVPSMGLIAASIVSKKIAGGAHGIVFDVKTGVGGFMRTVDEAAQLGRSMVDIARRFGRSATALITDMNEPLGTCIGTGIEIAEACELLRGERSEDRAVDLVLDIVCAMLRVSELPVSRDRVLATLRSGDAYTMFCSMVEAQGGIASSLGLLHVPRSGGSVVTAVDDGFVNAIDVVRLGNLGRMLATSNPMHGIVMHVRIGSYCHAGAPLFTHYGNAEALGDLASIVSVASTPIQPHALIAKTID
ncbi:MAG: thymidine phosphorylase [Vulcanimicrobiaceae bacterium]